MYTGKGFVRTSPDIAHLDAFETPAENTARCGPGRYSWPAMTRSPGSKDNVAEG
jgi:hypothetical protein